MQNWQHGPIPDRVEKLIRMPSSGKGSRFCLPVAYHASDYEIRVIESCPVGVGDAVTQLAPFVDRTGRLWGDVTADASGEGKLLEEFVHPLQILAHIGVNLGVSPF